MSRRLGQSEYYLKRLAEQARAKAAELNRTVRDDDTLDEDTQELLRGAAELLEEIGDAL